MNGYVLAANAAVWIALGGYAAYLVLRGQAAKKRLKQMEILGHGERR